MKELTYTLVETTGGVVMRDSEGFIVGIFSDVAEAEQAWPKIRYNITKVSKRVNLKYATLRYVRPTQYVLFANKRKQQHKSRK